MATVPCGRCGEPCDSAKGCKVCTGRYYAELDWLHDAANAAEAAGVTLGEYIAAAQDSEHDPETLEWYWGTFALDQDDIEEEC